MGLYGGIAPDQVMQQMHNQVGKSESYQQRLQRQLGESLERTKTIKEALDILERNPDLQRFLDLMGRI